MIIAAFTMMMLWQWATHAHPSSNGTYLHRPIPYVLSLLALSALILHAYLGIWTVLTDYVHQRCVFNASFVFAAGALFLFAWLIFVAIGVSA